MEFDKRITDISKIMNCFTVEKAKRYLHTSGYFADHIENFTDLDKLDMTGLAGIMQDSKYPYYEDILSFKFFLPCAFVADEKEKKLRPYKNISEFSNETGCEEVGTDIISISIRNKDTKHEYVLLYTGYCNNAVHLGGMYITLKSLFNYYEFLYEDKWLPFGVGECY